MVLERFRPGLGGAYGPKCSWDVSLGSGRSWPSTSGRYFETATRMAARRAASGCGSVFTLERTGSFNW